jgi:preprotein translocase subunit SecD
LFIGAAVYLHSDFSSRQRLAAWLCKPGYRLTFACRYPDGVFGVREAWPLESVRLVVAKRLDPYAIGAARVLAAPPDKIVVALDRRVFPQKQMSVDELVRFIERRGLLEFRVVPTTDRAELSADQVQQYQQALAEKGPESASDSQYTWVEIKNINEWHVPASVVQQHADEYYVLASNRPDEAMLHEPDGRGWKLEKAYLTTDGIGRRATGFTLNKQGGDLLCRVTRQNPERPLATILDDVAISAPTINPESPIREQGIIMGSFTAFEVSDMVAVLNGDPFPLELRLTESHWED